MSQLLDYFFKDQSLLNQALTHCSYVRGNSNERLEYLGDAILGAIITSALYAKFPHLGEGEMTRMKSALVKNATLADLAVQQGLSERLLLGKAELRTGGWNRKSILANAMEAVIGAIYLDAGFNQCRELVLAIYEDLLESVEATGFSKDPKTKLQEYLQARKCFLPVYSLIKKKGPSHEPIYTVSCVLESFALKTTAQAKSKRTAEQAAAQIALQKLDVKRSSG